MSPSCKRQSTISFKVKKNIRSAKKPSVDEVAAKVRNSNGVKTSPIRNKTDIACSSITPSTALSSLTLSSPAQLSNARKALHSASGFLPCREEEIMILETFIYGNINKGTSAAMYVSGVPGTGKTASLLQIIKEEKVTKNCHIVLINCTAIKSSGAIYLRICEALKIKITSKSEKCALTAIEKYLTRKHKVVLLVLDEIDQLESKFQSVLYTIFEWPSKVNSKLLLIGIANAVDLTDRLLPRLAASVKHKPTLLHFKPYTKDEICTILKHRLSQTGEPEIFAPGALELISAKVASQSGDVRRALDLGRRALEMTRRSEQIIPSAEPGVRRSPRKLSIPEMSVSPPKSKRTLNFTSETNRERSDAVVHHSVSASPRISRSFSSDGEKSTPKKKLFCDDASNMVSPRKRIFAEKAGLEPSPSKRSKDMWPETPKTPIKVEDRLKSSKRRSLFGSPKKSNKIQDGKSEENDGATAKCGVKNFKTEETPIKGSPKKNIKTLDEKENAVEALRRSPRKLSQQERGDSQFSVQARDVLSVVDQVYGNARNLRGHQPTFPIHQKLLICSLLLVLNKARRKDITVGKLHEVYSRVCSKRGLTAVDQSGFVSLCRQVEMAGAVELGKGPARLARINLQWDETEVAYALQDSSLLAAILNDTATLGSK